MKRLLRKEDDIQDIKLYTYLQEEHKSDWKLVPLRVLQFLTSTLWQTVVVFTIIFNYFLTSYSYIFLKKDMGKTSFYLILAMDLIYSVDYIVAVTIFIWKPIQNLLKKQPRSLLNVIVDFFLVFPYSYIYEVGVHKSYQSTVFLCLRAILIFRLFHVVLYFNEKLNSVGVNHFRQLVLQYVTYLLIIQQTVACLWYLIAFQNSHEIKRWKEAVEISKLYVSPQDLYIPCLYFALMNLTGRNFGDLVPLTSGGKLFLIAIIITGFILTVGFFIGFLSFLFEKKYKIREDLRVQMHTIDKYLKSTSLENKEKHIINSHYKILWKKKSGIHECTELTRLPFPLKSEISVDINIRLLQSSMIFRDKPEAFLRSVSCLMKQECYQPGQIIYHSHSVKDKMIFVVLGTIEILSEEDQESRIVAFDSGTCLGESSLVLALPSRWSVRTVCYTELLTLYRKDFYKNIDLFSQEYETIRQAIIQRTVDAERLKSVPEATPVVLSSTPQLQQKSNIKIFKDKLRNIIPRNAEEDKHLVMYQLNDSDMEINRETVFLSSKFPWYLNPDTSFYKFWEILVMLVAAFIGLFYPYYIIFLKQYPKWFIRSFLFTDFFLVFDILVILCTVIEENNKIYKTFTKILQKRLTQFGFYLDLLSCLWLEKFYVIFTENDRFEYVLRLNRLLKAYRIFKSIRKVANHLHAQIFPFRILSHVLCLLLSAYWLGALFYLTTCFGYTCTEDGWFFTKVMKDLKEQVAYSYTNHEILMSIYYSLFFLSGWTVSDIAPNNITDMILACVATLLGIFLFSFFVAELFAIITIRLNLVINFQESFTSINNFLKEKNIAKGLMLRVQTFFLLQWNYDKGAKLRPKPLFFNANTNIQTTVQIKEKMETITNVPLFQGKNLDFLQHIVTAATTSILPPNEFITRKGEVVEILYILQEGYCVRQIDNHEVVLRPKTAFGSIYLFASVKAVSTVKTLTHAKLLCIAHRDILKATSLFPSVAKQYQKVVDDLNIEDEIRKIPYIENVNIKAHTSDLEGSIVNMVSHCKEHNESYREPFNQIKYMCWIKMILLPICILPYGRFLKIWVTIRLAVAMMVALIVPYLIIQISLKPKLQYIILATDIIAYIDMYVMMLVGYYGPKNQLIMHPLKTATHYIKTKFIFDFVFCFPWEIFAFYLVIQNEQSSNSELALQFASWIRLLRVFQIYRLPQCLNYLSEDIRRKGNIVGILKFVLIVIIMINLFAALMIRSSCTYCSRRELLRKGVNKSRIIHSSPEFMIFCEQDSWIDKSKFRNYTEPYQVYIISTYFCTSIITTTGIGDITPQYQNGLTLTIIMLICGIIFLGYIYANMASYRAEWNSLFFKNQEMFNELKQFMLREKVRQDLREQIINGLEYRWQRAQGVEPNKLLSNLHCGLHEDIVLAMYENVLREVPAFENMTIPFFRVIGKLIKEEYYLQGECICETDDIASNIWIVYRGKVKITSDENDAVMESGGIFGNISQYNKNMISITVTAMTNVDIFSLKTKIFYDALQEYPLVQEKIDDSFSKGVDFIMPRTKEETKSPSTSTHKKWPSIAGCFLICVPWKLFRVVLPPYSFIYKFTDFLCLILTYTNCIFVVYEFAFQHHTSTLLSFAIVTDLIFLINLLIDLHKSYRDIFGEIITSKKMIIKRYFKKRTFARYICCLSTLPFHYLGFAVPSKSDPHLVFSALRMITLARFLDIFEYYEKKSNQISTNRVLLKMSSLIVWSSLVIHIFACGWYLCACPLLFCLKVSWFTNLLPEVEDKVEIYLTCLYFTIGLFTRASNGDVVPIRLHEQIYVTMGMVLFIFLAGIFIADIMNTLIPLTCARANYAYNIKELEIYLRNCNISKFQFRKMLDYAQQLWKTNNGQQIPHLLPLLPPSSINHIMSEIYGHHLKRSNIFSDVEDAFARQLSRYLRRTIFFPGDFIVKHGDLDKSMYFIHLGEVEILTVHPNLTETVHEILHIGELFGTTQGLFHGVAHHFSFRARTTVHTASLRLGEWEYLLNFFPDSKESIYMKANNIYT